MNTKDWIWLCGITSFYVLFGALVFMFFERHVEVKRNQEIATLRKDVKETLLYTDPDFYSNTTTPDIVEAVQHAKEGVLDRISDACDIGNLYDDHSSAHDTESVLTWNLYNSVFFSFTVITAIGYGFMTPTTNFAKIFLIVYALVGIPLSTLVLTGIGDFFTAKLINARNRSKEQGTRNKYTFVLEVLFYLLPGILIFFVLPSGLFVLIEGWKYMDALYFTFVTLTTIGFGDYVAGIGSGNTIWMWLYKAGIIMWILFGLGYLIMILGFITRGMKSKHVKVAIKKPLFSILQSKEKLSNDIDELKKIAGEIYAMNLARDLDEEHDNVSLNKEQRSRLNSILDLSEAPKGRQSSIASWTGLAGRNGSVFFPRNKKGSSTISSEFSPAASLINAGLQISTVHVLSSDVLSCLQSAMEGLDELENEMNQLPDMNEEEAFQEEDSTPKLKSVASSSSLLSKVEDTIRKISSGSWFSSAQSSPSRPRIPRWSRKNSKNTLSNRTSVASSTDGQLQGISNNAKLPTTIVHSSSDTNLFQKETHATEKMKRNVSFQVDYIDDDFISKLNNESSSSSHLIRKSPERKASLTSAISRRLSKEGDPNKQSSSVINQRRRKYGTVFKPNLQQLSLDEDELELQELKTPDPKQNPNSDRDDTINLHKSNKKD